MQDSIKSRDTASWTHVCETPFSRALFVGFRFSEDAGRAPSTEEARAHPAGDEQVEDAESDMR